MASKKLYEMTDEHCVQLKPWGECWIKNALSTEAMTEADREICRDAVERLYRAAKQTPPTRHRIVFVPSAFVARFAGGFAAWIWHRRSGRARAFAACDNASLAATAAATYAATYATTVAATYEATYAATDAATYATTYGATYTATADATYAATVAPNPNRYFVNGDIIACAWEVGVGKAGLMAAKNASCMLQGGNFRSADDVFLSFFRHIAKLPIDYESCAWYAWEELSLHSSWRIVHHDCCIISDRPEVLTVDGRNRPHNDTGPFCRWPDGSALYAVHGVRVPAWIIERPEWISLDAIDAEPNTEVQRVMIERLGWDRYAELSNAEIVDHDERWGTLYRRRRSGGRVILFVQVTNRSPEPDGSLRKYIMPVAVLRAAARSRRSTRRARVPARADGAERSSLDVRHARLGIRQAAGRIVSKVIFGAVHHG